jgi:hypothetical protein
MLKKSSKNFYAFFRFWSGFFSITNIAISMLFSEDIPALVKIGLKNGKIAYNF